MSPSVVALLEDHKHIVSWCILILYYPIGIAERGYMVTSENAMSPCAIHPNYLTYINSWALSVVTIKIMKSKILVQFIKLSKPLLQKQTYAKLQQHIFSESTGSSHLIISFSNPRDHVELLPNIKTVIQIGYITVDASVMRCKPLYKIYINKAGPYSSKKDKHSGRRLK